jgi:hypothetical protein
VNDHWIETYKSLVTLWTEAFKFSALVNGGAAVALLAYLGNIAGKGASAPDMRGPMLCFLAGLFFCGISMCFAYLTQYTLFNEERPNGPRLPPQSHKKYLWGAIIFYPCSLLAFAFGAWEAVGGFR